MEERMNKHEMKVYGLTPKVWAKLDHVEQVRHAEEFRRHDLFTWYAKDRKMFPVLGGTGGKFALAGCC
jgi:hypothetical protein